jgi:hypothetical protein
MDIRRVLEKTLQSSVAATVLVLGSVGVASASPSSSPLSAGAQTLRATVTNSACAVQVQLATARGTAGVSADACTATVVTKSSAASRVTAADLVQAKATLSASEYASLAAAVASATVYHKAYSQTISQITDQEEQYGTFYYNGSRAWVTVSYAGHKGSHYCVVNYAVGYTITKDYCTDGGSTSKRTLTMVWNVAVGLIANGPISWTETYKMYVSASGAITK